MLSTCVIALVLGAILQLVKADECTFTAYEVVEKEKIIECYKKVGASGSELGGIVSNTVDNVKNYLDVSVFTNHYTSEKYFDQPLDIVQEVGKLATQAYDYEYQFHANLTATMMRLRDPHSVYRMPGCFTKIYFALPFAVSSKIDEEGKQVLFLNDLPKDYGFVTLAYQKAYGEDASELMNKIGDVITGLKISDVQAENGDSPVEILAKWADKHVYVSKHRDTRFNRAVRRDFFIRGADFPMPSEEVTLIFGEGANQKEYTLPWLAIPTKSFGGVADLESYCPLVHPPEDDTQVEIKSSEEPLIRMVRELQEMPPAPKDIYGNGISQKEAKLTPSFSLSSDDSSLIRLYQGDEIALFDYNGTVIIDGQEAGKKTAAIISIPSFSPASYDQWLLDLQNILDMLVLVQDENGEILNLRDMLVIDVRDNGGGYVDLGIRLLFYLFPDLAKPSSGRYERRKCALNDILNDLGYFKNEEETMYDYLSHSEVPFDTLYTDSKYHHTTTISDNLKSDYMINYTFGPPDFYSFTGTRRSDMGDNYRVTLPYNPGNTYILTEGYCGSTCATFAMHAAEIHAGKFIGLGGIRKGSSSDVSTGVASFAGGTVLDSEYIESVMAAYDISRGSYGDQIPNPMPRNGYIRFPNDGLLSWVNGDDYPLEFKTMLSDWQVPYWPRPQASSTADELKEVMDAVFKDIFTDPNNNPINTKYTWVEAMGDNSNTIENAQGGLFWDGNAFTTAKPAYCLDGYYASSWDEDGYIAECGQFPETIISSGPFTIVAWVFIALTLAVLIGVGIYWGLRIFVWHKGCPYPSDKADKKSKKGVKLEEEDSMMESENNSLLEDHSSSNPSDNSDGK